MKLTSRTKQILYILLEESDYITNQYIAEQIGVSSRTILREMNFIKKWLQKFQVSLDRKKGIGIRILANDTKREEIRKSLKGEKEDIFFTPQLRYIRLKFELLQTYEPRKIYSFSKLFGVTEGTISNDLDNIETWFKKYGIELIRKQGIGVYIKGREISIRKAMVALIYENVKESDLLNFIENKTFTKPINLSSYQKDVKDYLIELMEVEYIDRIKTLLNYLEERMRYQLSDNSFIEVMLYFLVTLKRIKQNMYLTLSIQPYIEHQLNGPEYEIIKDLLSKDDVLKQLYIPSDEIKYLTMHIKGAKRREVSNNSPISIIEDYHLIKLAKKMIYIAQVETGAYLEDNQKLLVGLVRHLGPAINRIKLNLDIVNPLLEDIKSSYPKLFQVTKQCVKVIENEEKIIVPEDEIAYIATHIGAAMERETRAINKKFRVVIACINGIGASRLLASEIKKEFNNVNIIDTISTIDLDETFLKNLNIDLIITTVPINITSIPTVLVNNILTKEDKVKIKNFLDNYVPSTKGFKKQQISLKEKLNILNKYSESILQILDNFFLIKDVKCSNMDELIKIVSEKIISDAIKKNQLIQAFKDREEKGATLLGQKGMILLHCRSQVIDELYFMVIRLKNTIETTDKRGVKYEVNTIAVMVAPIDTKGYELEVLSEITRVIISSNFGKALKNHDEITLYEQLNRILEDFYQNKSYDLLS
ncbi:BglG family transcription antiterminator [Defluviitalea phaphyphila]|uniref:BglG family transcription antiterminator n=1 Tax=Defluviitalea phaphyphila TaxID=1473580 RepID=UPI000730FB1A|nr:BglG family transcription antiterminator [Defluviitalea phaphyphila]